MIEKRIFVIVSLWTEKGEIGIDNEYITWNITANIHTNSSWDGISPRAFTQTSNSITSKAFSLKINLNYNTITRNFVVSFHLISTYRNAVDSKFAYSIVWQFLMKEVVSLALWSLVYLSTSTNFFSWIFILISSISSLVSFIFSISYSY